MGNYKIRVNSKTVSKEAQELFFELGYGFFSGKNKAAEDFEYTGEFYFFAYGSDFDLTVSKDRNLFIAKNDFQEINLPQLRDLVVLKRNDVKDANYRSKNVSDGLYFKSCDGIFYFMFEGKWVQSEVNTDEGLVPITQDSALIGGRDAWLANFDGIEVEYRRSTNEKSNWYNFAKEEWTNEELKSGPYEFRLKPQTIKLELEIPAPFQPKEGEECCYITDESIDGYHTIDYSSERYNGMHFGLYRPSDIKKVVALFRSALGG